MAKQQLIIDVITQVNKSVLEQTRKAIDSVTSAVKPVDLFPKSSTASADAVKKSIEDVKRTIDTATRTPSQIKFEGDFKPLDEELKKKPAEAKKEGEKSGKSFGSSFKDTAKGFLVGSVLFAGLSAGVGALKSATAEFVEFDKQLANVASLGVDNVKGLGDSILQLSKQTADSASQLTGAAYQAISAGIQGTNEEIAGFLSQASKVAVAGGATTENAVDSLTSVMNAYKLEVAEAGKVSDIFFGAIKGGKTDFAQLRSSISNIIPAASAAKISFEEVAANVAQLTTLGIPTAQATTQIRAAIIEVQKPAKDLADVMKGVGVEIDGVRQTLDSSNIGQVLEKQGLTKTLQQIQESAEAQGKSINQVFSSSEAANAVLALTGDNAEKANAQIQAIKDSIEEGASTSAFEEASKSIDNQMKLVRNNLQSVFNEIFVQLLPAVNKIIQGILPVLSGLAEKVGEVVGGLAEKLLPIVEILFDALQPIFDLIINDVMPILATAFDLVAEILKQISPLLKPIAALLQPILKVVDVLLILVQSILKGLAPVLDNLIKNLTDIITIGLKPMIPILDALTPVFEVLGVVIGALVNLNLVPLMIKLEIFAQIMTALSPLIIRLSEWIAELAKAFSGVMKKALDEILPLINDAVEFISDLVASVLDFLGLVDKEIKAPIDKNKKAMEELGEEYKETKEEIKETAEATDKNTKALNSNTTAKKSNSKAGLELIESLKKEQDEKRRIAAIEDEITRIREERSKGTKDEIVELKRELDDFESLRNSIRQSLRDGFIAKEDGTKIKLTADEKVELGDTIKQLNRDIFFAEKNLEKLTVKLLVEDKNIKEFTTETLKKLQRERVELEIDLGIRPKDDLLDIFEEELKEFDEAIAEARLENDIVKQNELMNEKLKLEKKYTALLREISEKRARDNADAYNKSFRKVADDFNTALTGSFEAVKPDDSAKKMLQEEIKTIEERKRALLRSFKDGQISAQEFNQKLFELEKARVDKSIELDRKKELSAVAVQKGVSKSLEEMQKSYDKMSSETIENLLKLEKQERDYQEVLSSGKEVPPKLEEAHKKYTETNEQLYNQLAVVGTTAFADVLIAGENLGKEFPKIALATLDKLIPIFVAQIMGKSFAELGPLGLAAATGLIIAFKGAVAVARSAVGGAFKGAWDVRKGNLGKPGRNDKVPALLEEGEAVASVETVARNPILKYLIRDHKDENWYFENMYLPKYLKKKGIEMPGVAGAFVLPEKQKQINQLAAKIQQFDVMLNKEIIPGMVLKEREAQARKDNNSISEMQFRQIREDNKLLREELKKMRAEFILRTHVNVEGRTIVKGQDIEVAIKNRKRRELA